MPKPHLLQLANYPAPDQGALDAAYTLHRLPLTEPGLIEAIATSGGAGVPPEIIRACPNLKLIAIYGVGYDAIDLGLCAARNIRVTNTPDVLNGDCADLAVGMALALSRQIPQAQAHIQAGLWTAADFPLQTRFWGARAGILGLGRIGMEVARRLEGFGMQIAYCARSAKPVPYRHSPDPATLAAEVDFLFVTALANAETRHIVDANVLASLGPQGYLINISRAANIDEAALLDALESRQIAGAALDVFEAEPALNPRFLTLPNVLLQPHHASATQATRAAMGQLMRDNLAAHFAGQPLPTPVQPTPVQPTPVLPTPVQLPRAPATRS